MNRIQHLSTVLLTLLTSLFSQAQIWHPMPDNYNFQHSIIIKDTLNNRFTIYPSQSVHPSSPSIGIIMNYNGQLQRYTGASWLPLIGYTAENIANRGIANGYPSLDANGKIPSSQINPIPLGYTFINNSQASMLADTAHIGDISKRTDSTKVYILRALPASNYGNWVLLNTSIDNPVITVNGQYGTVILTAADIGALSSENDPDWHADSASYYKKLMVDSKLSYLVSKSTTINGHNLSSNMTISASDITTGTLPHAQLPILISGDIPNNAANTSGNAAGLSNPYIDWNSNSGGNSILNKPTLTSGTVTHVYGINTNHVNIQITGDPTINPQISATPDTGYFERTWDANNKINIEKFQRISGDNGLSTRIQNDSSHLAGINSSLSGRIGNDSLRGVSYNSALGTRITNDSIKNINDIATATNGAVVQVSNNYNASTNLFPSTGVGGGSINAGDYWYVTTGGLAGGNPNDSIYYHSTIIALVNSPGQIRSNWNINASGSGNLTSQIAGSPNKGVPKYNGRIAMNGAFNGGIPTTGTDTISFSGSMILNSSNNDVISLTSNNHQGIIVNANGTGNAFYGVANGTGKGGTFIAYNAGGGSYSQSNTGTGEEGYSSSGNGGYNHSGSGIGQVMETSTNKKISSFRRYVGTSGVEKLYIDTSGDVASKGLYFIMNSLGIITDTLITKAQARALGGGSSTTDSVKMESKYAFQHIDSVLLTGNKLGTVSPGDKGYWNNKKDKSDSISQNTGMVFLWKLTDYVRTKLLGYWQKSDTSTYVASVYRTDTIKKHLRAEISAHGGGAGTLTGSGTSSQVPFFTGSTILAGDTNYTWDNTNKSLAIGKTGSYGITINAGMPIYNAPSYSNTGGTGNRIHIITTTGNFLTSGQLNVNLNRLINGDKTTNDSWWYSPQTITTSFYLRFNFHSAKVINEVTYYQSTTQAEGTWQWQGSNDSINWTNIGTSFAFGGATTQVITAMSANTTPYIYYQMKGVSGSLSQFPYVYQMEFKIGALITSPSITTPTDSFLTKLRTKQYLFPYDITNFGAVADGIELHDGQMYNSHDTLTSNLATFSTADVGKSIMIDTMALSGTITTYVSAHKIRLSFTANKDLLRGKFAYGTDNTISIQNAINASASTQGSKVIIPSAPKFYVLAGALQTNIGGLNYNSQLYIPAKVYTSDRTCVVIEGQSPPDELHSDVSAETWKISYGGCTLYSFIQGSGNDPAVIASTASTSVYGTFNFNDLYIKNLKIVVPANKDQNGPNLWGVMARQSAQTNIENFLFAMNEYAYKTIQPTAEVGGIYIGSTNADLYNSLRNVMVWSTKYSIVCGEHVLLDNVFANQSLYGFVIPDGYFTVTANMVEAFWCKYPVYFPNYNFHGSATTGKATINFQMIEFEYATTGKWYDSQTKFVVDSGNKAYGRMTYHIVRSGSGFANAIFTKYNALNLNCIQSDQLFPHNFASLGALGTNANTHFYQWNSFELGGANVQNNMSQLFHSINIDASCCAPGTFANYGVYNYNSTNMIGSENRMFDITYKSWDHSNDYFQQISSIKYNGVLTNYLTIDKYGVKLMSDSIPLILRNSLGVNYWPKIYGQKRGAIWFDIERNRFYGQNSSSNVEFTSPSSVTKSSNYTLTLADKYVWVTGTTNITLLASPPTDYEFFIKNISTGTVTIVGVVDGITNPTLSQNAFMRIKYDGSSWWIIAH